MNNADLYNKLRNSINCCKVIYYDEESKIIFTHAPILVAEVDGQYHSFYCYQDLHNVNNCKILIERINKSEAYVDSELMTTWRYKNSPKLKIPNILFVYGHTGEADPLIIKKNFLKRSELNGNLAINSRYEKRFNFVFNVIIY